MESFASERPLRTALLHASKHPCSGVLGALFGTTAVEGAVPFFHTAPTTPLLEVALDMFSESYPLAGFYEARIMGEKEALEPSPLLNSLCVAAKDKLKKPVFALCITNNWSAAEVVAVYRVQANATRLQKVTGLSQVPLEFLKNSPEICDFEDHFQNPQLDWRNPHLSSLE